MNIIVCQYADMTSPRFSMAATKYEQYFQFSLHGNRIDKNDLTMNGFQSENNIKIMEFSFKTPVHDLLLISPALLFAESPSSIVVIL